MMAALITLTWPSLIGGLGLVRRQTICTLSNQCAQVQPAVYTRTLESSPRWQQLPAMYHYKNLCNKPDF